MKRSNPRNSNDESGQKHMFPRVPGENIRRHLLKSAISKKVANCNDSEPEYGDSLLSSDENSDCCSEPSNRTEDIEFSEHNDKKRVKIVCSNGKYNSKGVSEEEKTTVNSDCTSFKQRSRDRSGSLQNASELLSGVI